MTGYVAARERAAWLDRGDRVRVEFTGDQSASTLNGLLTSDVIALRPGDGQYAAALTPKGKVIADLRVFAREGLFLADTDAAAGAPLLAMLRKYVNPRLAKFRDVSAELGDITIVGPDAARLAAAVSGVAPAAVSALPPFGHAAAASNGVVLVARTPEFGVAAFDVIIQATARDAIVGAFVATGADALDAPDAETLRVEAGWPRFGRDFDDAILAQEAGLDRLGAISLTKGCYTGQETVARVHFRGHVNRTLRGLRAEAPLVPGSPLVGADGNVVGEVRSVAVSPRLGPVALAYVRREVADGDRVTARQPGGDLQVSVVPLPFS